MKTLLAEAKSAAGVSGTLAAKAHFEGSGGLPTMKGRGQGTSHGCRVEHGRTLALLAGILQVPELASPDFDECRAEFTQSGTRLSTPVLRLTGEAVQLSGRARVNLSTSGLDYQMSLALAPEALREGHPPRAAAGVQAAGRRVLRRSTSASTGRRSTRRPTSSPASARPPPRGVAKDQLDRLFKRKVF